MTVMDLGREMRRADLAAEAAARRALLRTDEPRTAPETGEPVGAGWYESSWELRQGLDVREGWPADFSVAEWSRMWG